ncbi:MAG TPA: type II toxin-antitoxin system VapC family toxin [Dehalococcoidia bacterium]|nr:type II toxin-antitoxin system VapC family toxin [Dehalococcoidia bacterium]
MRYLLDADWVINYLRGKTEAVEPVTALADEGLAMSLVTYGEVLEGLGGSPSAQLAHFDQLAEALELLTLDVEICRRYAQTRAHLRSRGELIPDNDLWIAATALRHDLVLLSHDHHFTRIPGLSLFQTR